MGTPWNFATEYPSPNGKAKLVYGSVGEVAMSAPLAGDCFLIMDGEKFELNGLYGGPAIWSENSARVAIPYWTKSRSQKLAIIDLQEMTIKISEKDFRVIELTKYKGGVVSGIDSPIYRSENIAFQPEAEPYSQEIEIITGHKT